jgi:hypothetical protein
MGVRLPARLFHHGKEAAFLSASISRGFVQKYYCDGAGGEQAFENVTDMMICP